MYFGTKICKPVGDVSVDGYKLFEGAFSSKVMVIVSFPLIIDRKCITVIEGIDLGLLILGSKIHTNINM